MADPFTPKFVDLVRNTATTTGTGNFVLGPAVNGFTGFAQALQPGDRFYYSAIGIDKPAEREVGRGTLLAGGAISREPISGAKTNFTIGSKSVALIAAAEWFASVQGGACLPQFRRSQRWHLRLTGPVGAASLHSGRTLLSRKHYARSHHDANHRGRGQWVRGGAVDGSSLGCRGDRNPHPVEQHVGDQHSRPVAVEQRFRIHSPQPRAVRRLQRIE